MIFPDKAHLTTSGRWGEGPWIASPYAEYTRDDLVAEKDARIAFLEKALEQAINIGEIGFEPYGNIWSPTLQTGHACEIPIDGAFFELAAYLRERDSRPPESGVQSGVQEGDDNAEMA